ncbi:energy transducer TonB [Hymenobacter negativus]|uniref:TonB C-terminal domain-containing protein n=1 Tax=Hymenobacter negativus TaxID=2795026 RepID=A0ABS0Q312_9BACT|nr:hypothetical protein [Hymenobacter negativus]MBH8557040.1 hypothetical protein [Hymenobacter negativus]
MKHGILTAIGCVLGHLAHAQTYAAPGMPLHLQRGLPVVSALPPKPPTKSETVAQPLSPVIPRFWHAPDSVKLKAAKPFYQFTGSKLTYPANTMRAEIEGNFSARLTVMTDGSVGSVIITRREVIGDAVPLYYARGLTDLEAEIVRVMKLVRFEPGAAADTITITSRFRMQ